MNSPIDSTQMSDTPRCDAEALKLSAGPADAVDKWFAFMNLARELERELSELNRMGGHLYCTTCGSCGHEGCCSVGKCWKARYEELERNSTRAINALIDRTLEEKS